MNEMMGMNATRPPRGAIAGVSRPLSLLRRERSEEQLRISVRFAVV